MFVVTQRAKDQLAELAKGVGAVGGSGQAPAVDPDEVEETADAVNPYDFYTDAHASAEGHENAHAKAKADKAAFGEDDHAAPYGGAQDAYGHTVSPGGEVAAMHHATAGPIPGVAVEHLQFQPESLAYNDMLTTTHVSTGYRENGGNVHEMTDMRVPVRNFDARSAAMPGVTDFSAARTPMGPNQQPRVSQVADNGFGRPPFVTPARTVTTPTMPMPGGAS